MISRAANDVNSGLVFEAITSLRSVVDIEGVHQSRHDDTGPLCIGQLIKSWLVFAEMPFSGAGEETDTPTPFTDGKALV